MFVVRQNHPHRNWKRRRVLPRYRWLISGWSFPNFFFFFSFYLVLLFNFSVDTSLQSVYFHLIDWLIEECRADFVESSPSVYFYLIYWIFIGGCLVVAWNLLKCLPGQQSLELSNSVVTYFFNSEWISLSLV